MSQSLSMGLDVRPGAEARPAPRKGPGAFSAFERLVAWRYLRSKRRESIVSLISIISFLGIMLGVATLIIVMAVMNGFRTELLSRILGLNGHLHIVGEGAPLTGYEGLAREVRALPGVTRAAPMVEAQVMAASGEQVSGALVRGLTPADLASLDIVANHILTGSLIGFAQEPSLVVGNQLAARLGLGVGDRLTLVSPRGSPTPFGVAPRQKSYPIAATFQVGMYEFDQSYIFMPLDEARLFFQKGEAVDGIEVMVDNPDQIMRYRAALYSVTPPGTAVRDWQQANSSFFGALQTERTVMFLILTLIILVASLNIVSGLVMLVKDKAKDIAVLRTMGASRGSILRIFFLSGAVVGVMGTLAGFVIGVLFCLNIEDIRQFVMALLKTEIFPPDVYFLAELPAEIDNGEVAAVVLMALTLSFLAPLYPSWRAARVDPVEGLRYE